MMWEARKGMQVVCISDWWGDPIFPSASPPAVSFPVKGCIYTIRGVGCMDQVYLWLEEIVNPHFEPDRTTEPSFAAGGFRPLRDAKTDISVFKKLLVPSPKELA